jgi:hypothetical protein
MRHVSNSFGQRKESSRYPIGSQLKDALERDLPRLNLVGSDPGRWPVLIREAIFFGWLLQSDNQFSI